MRLSVSKTRLFLLAFLLAFLSSSAPILAIQNSAFMRVYDLKAGHSKRVLAGNNPIMFVDPEGLETEPYSQIRYRAELRLQRMRETGEILFDYNPNNFDRGNGFGECMSNCMASKDPLSVPGKAALYALGGPIPKSVASQFIGRRSLIAGQSAFTTLPSMLSVKLKAGGRSLLRGVGRGSSRLFTGYTATYAIFAAECLRVCSDDESECES